MLALTIRLVASLAIVVGLLLLLAHFGRRKFASGSGNAVQVLHRQQLSRSATLTVVSIGSRTLVLGTTDQQVNLLTELDPAELDHTPLGLDEHGGINEPDATDETDELVADFARSLDLASFDLASSTHSATPVATPGSTDRSVHPLTAHGRASRSQQSVQVTRLGAQDDTPGHLAGSVLSAATWRQAYAAVRHGGR